MRSYRQNRECRILITGVSRGLGRALCEFFIAHGHIVHGCARSADKIAELAHRYGAPHTFHVVDVSQDDQVRAWIDELLCTDAIPDIVINNAAVIGPLAPLWETITSDFDKCIDINIKGVANVLRRILPPMIMRKSGVIVNISSGWGRSVSPNVSAYCATKWAIEGLTKALANELPHGMAAVALNPGVIDTEMLRACFGEHAKFHPKPATWATKAGPFILSLGPEHNGASLTVPL